MGIRTEALSENLELLLSQGANWIDNCDGEKFSFKPSETRWSKKEILGHLIDSALNNLQRFTEVQFEEKPFQIVNYNQDALVKVNDYQNAETDELLQLWLSLNHRIFNIIARQSRETLAFELRLPDGTKSNLGLLMTDYVSHMSHHVRQIVDELQNSIIKVILGNQVLQFNLSLGLTYEGAEDGAPQNYTLHVEQTYEFEIQDLHLGPVLEFAYDEEDYNVNWGIHIGLGF